MKLPFLDLDFSSSDLRHFGVETVLCQRRSLTGKLGRPSSFLIHRF